MESYGVVFLAGFSSSVSGFRGSYVSASFLVMAERSPVVWAEHVLPSLARRRVMLLGVGWGPWCPHGAGTVRAALSWARTWAHSSLDPPALIQRRDS